MMTGATMGDDANQQRSAGRIARERAPAKWGPMRKSSGPGLMFRRNAVGPGLRVLPSAACEVLSFASGTQFPDSPATRESGCVVLDLHMPGMNGFEVHARLAQSWPQVPVVAVTGHHSEESHAQSLMNRPFADMTKPIDNRVLLDTFDRVMSPRGNGCHGTLGA